MNNLAITPDEAKEHAFNDARTFLAERSLTIASEDTERPWGGFLVIDETQATEFIAAFFPHLSAHDIERGGRLTPKFLLVEPHKRLSWQYHERREEIWNVIEGPVGVMTSSDDTHGDVQLLNTGQTVQFGAYIRHRLVGLDGWGVVAEIWQHTDPNNPSEEDDIIRIEDDFDRQPK